jgi:hypothetical protein
MLKKIYSSLKEVKEDPKKIPSPPFFELPTARPVLLISLIGGLLALTAGI